MIRFRIRPGPFLKQGCSAIQPVSGNHQPLPCARFQPRRKKDVTYDILFALIPISHKHSRIFAGQIPARPRLPCSVYCGHRLQISPAGSTAAADVQVPVQNDTEGSGRVLTRLSRDPVSVRPGHCVSKAENNS